MVKLLEILPIVLLAIGQIMQTYAIHYMQKRIDLLEEFPKFLLNALKENTNGTEEQDPQHQDL